MSLIKDLSKEKKQIDVRIKKITKTRLNDRTSRSWVIWLHISTEYLLVPAKKILVGTTAIMAAVANALLGDIFVLIAEVYPSCHIGSILIRS